MKAITRSLKNVSGFTVMEIMVVVCMIGIMAAIAIPTFSSWMPNYRLKRAARDLYANLNRAKMGAIRNNSEWRVYFNTGVSPGSYTLYSDPGDDTWNGGGNDIDEMTINLSDYNGVDFGRPAGVGVMGDDYAVAPTGTLPATNFTPRGTVDHTGYIYLSNEKGTCYAVGTPSPSGVVILRRWINGEWR